MSAKGGCGCGGSSAGVAIKGGCECGSSGGSTGSMAGEGFARPRFFGGMLLTEDDLQAAVDYTVAKRRLTNRHVIGAGVVDGLDVTCHPCDAGKVNVSPGYAIECCGNDILVSCQEEVDIIALVRDLRRRTGVDCGEPCDDQPHQDYYLSIRYAEAPTAPVAPYASDDCATGECEFSRIREGYRFELRCEGPDDAATVIEALAACRPDAEVVEADARTMANVVRLATTYSDLVAGMASGPEPVPAAPTQSEFDAVAGDVKLADGSELVTRATRALAFDAAAAKGTVAAQRLDVSRRAMIAARTGELAARLRTSEELKAQPPEEMQRIERILTTAEAQPDLSDLGPLDRAWLAEGTTAQEAERQYVAGAEKMRGRILRELAGNGQTSCDEYRRVSAMRLDRLTAASKDDANALGRAYVRSTTACACSAFNPPCPTCTDDAVVLAKVRVDGCDVTDVCALERRWVPSPRALDYWFPVVEMFRQCLEQACCEPTASGGAAQNPLSCVRASLADARTTFEQALAFAGPVTPVPVPAPAPSASSDVAALDARIAELGKRIDELSAGQKKEEQR
jgi:hypothetical protein